MDTIKVPAAEFHQVKEKADKLPNVVQREGLMRSLLRRGKKPPAAVKPKYQRTKAERTRDAARKRRRLVVRESRRRNRVKNWKKR